MAGIGFNDLAVAKRLKQIALTPDALSGDEGLGYTDAYFVRTPPTGIPAIVGTTLGKAVCDCYELSYDDATGDADLVATTDSDDNAITVTVHHAGGTPIGGDTLLIVAFMYGLYIPVVEYCL
ncbi:hypothetical protein [Stieleria mannarensis]|uniref:hypothetical protein n=1 Tax=Stieleria mannarensis TaxID=2755585 RepID=UPI001601B324|nr:hypothetical protein [Rhodopirellula sp. JC639]